MGRFFYNSILIIFVLFSIWCITISVMNSHFHSSEMVKKNGPYNIVVSQTCIVQYLHQYHVPQARKLLNCKCYRNSLDHFHNILPLYISRRAGQFWRKNDAIYFNSMFQSHEFWKFVLVEATRECKCEPPCDRTRVFLTIYLYFPIEKHCLRLSIPVWVYICILSEIRYILGLIRIASWQCP